MRCVTIFSGGMDSTTLLWQLLAAGNEVHALSFDYGQRHRKEVAAAKELVEHARARFGALMSEWRHVDLTGVRELIARGSQTGGEPVPFGHYAEESMKRTVVPNRNMVMLSVAGGYAITKEADALYYGAHGGDHAIYPDCRETFVTPLADALANADWHRVRLMAPFLSMTKADIAREGARLGVPFELTWSCYVGRAYHCGRCGTCVERREAFELAGVADVTVYEPRP